MVGLTKPRDSEEVLDSPKLDQALAALSAGLAEVPLSVLSSGEESALRLGPAATQAPL